MGNNTFTKNYADGSILTAAHLDTALQTVQPDIAQLALSTTGSTSGQFLTSQGSNVAPAYAAVPDPKGPFALRNYGLAAVASANNLVISLKTNAGTNPTASDVVDFAYSTNGTTSATYTAVQVTAACSISVTASATLGNATTSTQRIFIYGYYNTAAAAVKLAVSSRGDLDVGAAITTVAMSASADSISVLYATAVLTVVPRGLGWVEAAHATAAGGNWQTPTKMNVTNNAQRAVVLSGDSAAFGTSSATYVDVTNLSLNLTTTGRPVYLSLISSGLGSASISAVWIDKANQDTATGDVAFVRDTTVLNVGRLKVYAEEGTNPATSLYLPGSAFTYIDTPPAGTYTYKVQGKGVDSVIYFYRLKLIAYEL